jgi:hypothetical protein
LNGQLSAFATRGKEGGGNVRKDEGTKGPEEISNLKIFPNHDPCLLVGDLDDLEEFTHAGERRRQPL